jgi:dienelactone hydrolase
LPPNGDLDAGPQIAETVDGMELFLYPGNRHLFANNSRRNFDESAAALLKRRVLGFLDNIV